LLLARSSKVLRSDVSSAPLLSSKTDSAWLTSLDAEGTAPPSAEELVKSLASLGQGQTVVLVDNTSTPTWGEHYSTLLKAGVSVVTPNKKAFSSTSTLWNAITSSAKNYSGPSNSGYAFHESTVGAGLPVLSTLVDLIETGDVVTRIEGVFSGTMSFLFNTWDPVEPSGAPVAFSAAVKEAKDKGYTEPDARDDLNGMDVARKLTILARLVGLDIADATSVPVQSLVPASLESVSADAFLEGLSEHDSSMSAIQEEAKKEGKVVRFVGSLDAKAKTLKVGLEKFDKTHPIAALKGSDNIISFYTERYGSNALIIQGAGAGGDVTAMGVLADLLKIIRIAA
jgi:homoserine dehydrogenase